MNRPWIRTALVLVIFATIFLALSVGCYRMESATFDEPANLAAGYSALKLSDYRLDPEHPPLLRMWAAVPLLAIPDIKLDTDSPYWRAGDLWRFCHQFLFRDNDADHLLFRARLMIALLGVLLGILLFLWARNLFGFWPAVIILGMYCTEPNLLAHSGLVTTDLGATCFMFGAVYFAWRISRRFDMRNLMGLTMFFALAQVSKYSAVLLIPVVTLLLGVRSLGPAPWPWEIGRPKSITTRGGKARLSALTLLGLLVAAYFVFWAVYAFRYAPTPGGVERFAANEAAHDRLPQLTRFMQWVDRQHLLPNACSQGFTSVAVEAQQRSAYLMGKFSEHGWWYYFPLAFLVKTPTALLLMAITGLILATVRRTTSGLDLAFVVVPPAVYLATAMFGRVNIGVRYVLPIYPFVLLTAGWTIATFFSTPVGGGPRWRSLVLAALCLTQVVEFLAVYPHCLAFFNSSVGGPPHGADYLVDSNLDWGQGLKLLKRWMTENNIRHINLSYFGTADPAYYGIEYTPLPGTTGSDQSRGAQPQLPGYVVVSATNLRGAYLNDSEKKLYASLREQDPVAVLGYCLYVYRVERPWW